MVHYLNKLLISDDSCDISQQSRLILYDLPTHWVLAKNGVIVLLRPRFTHSSTGVVGDLNHLLFIGDELWLIVYESLFKTHEISHLGGIFTSREASATIAIHWNIISNDHFPFFISNTSTSTYAYVVIFRFWTENESLFRVRVYQSWISNPWTWSGAPHLANGLCPFGITANLMWRPRHWAVWIDPGTKTWLLFKQNARQNVFNWVLCSHFSQFQKDQVHIQAEFRD